MIQQVWILFEIWFVKMTKKQLFLLCLIIVVVMAGYGLFMPIIPYLIEVKKINASVASLLLSFYALGQFISSPIFGNYADHNGSKKTLLVGIIGYFISLTLSLSTLNLMIMLPLRLIAGAFAGACVSSIENYIGKMTDEKKRAENYTMTSLSIGIGMSIGPILGIGYLLSPKLITIVIALIGLLSIFATKYLIIDDFGAVEQLSKVTFKKLLINLQTAAKDSRNRYILLSFFLFGLITSGLEAIGIVYVMHFVTISIPLIILIIIGICLLAIFIMYINPKLINRYNKMTLSLNLIILIIIGLLLIMCTFSSNLMVIGAFLMVGAMSALIISLTTLITEINNNSGLMLGARNSTLSLGSIVGPILLSTIYNINANLTMLGLIIVALIILLIGKTIRRKNESY